MSTPDPFPPPPSPTGNAPTVANAIIDISTAEDAAFSFVVPADAFFDIDPGDVLTYIAKRTDGSALPGWLTFNASTLLFSGTPANGDVGILNVRVTATDRTSLSISDDFALTVTNVNDAPVAGSYSDRTVGLNAPVSLNLGMLFSDVDVGDVLSYSATGLPAGLSINAVTGLISGTAPSVIGLSHIIVTGTDTHAASASLNFDLDVIAGHLVTADVVTRSGVALPGVSVHELLGATQNNFSLGSTGQYAKTLPDGALALSMERSTADLVVAGKMPITAVDALDALKLSVGLAASQGSSWKELIAADMNHDGRVTAADALEILKASVGINTIQPSWVFVPNDAAGLAGMTTNTVTHTNSWNLSSITSPTATAFTGILVGDVNNSWLIPG